MFVATMFALVVAVFVLSVPCLAEHHRRHHRQAPSPSSSLCNSCPVPWVRWQNNYYQFNACPKDWFGARADCRRQGGDLAWITAQSETEWIAFQIDNLWGSQNFPAWIGAFFNTCPADRRSTWFWTGNPAPVDYQNFGVSQNVCVGPIPKCAFIYDAFRWNYEVCDSKHRKFYICKSRSNPNDDDNGRFPPGGSGPVLLSADDFVSDLF